MTVGDVVGVIAVVSLLESVGNGVDGACDGGLDGSAVDGGNCGLFEGDLVVVVVVGDIVGTFDGDMDGGFDGDLVGSVVGRLDGDPVLMVDADGIFEGDPVGFGVIGLAVGSVVGGTVVVLNLVVDGGAVSVSLLPIAPSSSGSHASSSSPPPVHEQLGALQIYSEEPHDFA